MKKHLLWLLPVVVVTGCVKDIAPENNIPEKEFTEFTDDEIKFLALKEMPAKLDSDEIDRIIADVVSLMEETPSTRSGGTRTVAAIRPMTAPIPADRSTRGGGSTATIRDTLFHIVDFADGCGWCIIAADRRIPEEVACFVGHGSFPDDFPARQIENPGLALMMDAARIYARRSLSKYEAWCDSVETALIGRMGVDSFQKLTASSGTSSDTRLIVEPFVPSWYTHLRIGPLVPVEWSQKAPFNTTVVENTSWKNTPAGCVALAAVGLMAYWQHPVQFHGLAEGNIDWKEINRWSGPEWNRENRYKDWDGPMTEASGTTQKLVADILWHVGNDIGMNYGPSASSAYTYRVTDLLAEHGYSDALIKSYSRERVQASISARQPVLIDGASHMSEDKTFYSNAHAWVIDGYLEQRRWEAFFIDNHIYEVETLRGFFHSNFGWGGTDNGYYACGMFDANNDPHLPSNTRIEWMGEHYNYQFLMTTYTGIYKR